MHVGMRAKKTLKHIRAEKMLKILYLQKDLLKNLFCLDEIEKAVKETKLLFIRILLFIYHSCSPFCLMLFMSYL